MKTQKTITRTFGIFFLLAFLSYGFGSGLAASVTDAADTLQKVQAHKNQLIIGVILMALLHTIVNIGLPVLMVPILKSYNKVLSYGYLSAGITATVVLIFGSILLLLHVPLSAMYENAVDMDSSQYKTIGTLLTKGNFYAYQIGMAIWGIGGLMFCYVLYISRLIPRGLSVWGFGGYVVFISGTIAELFGYKIGVLLSIPAGLFEITLSVWLIIKGFNASALSTR